MNITGHLQIKLNVLNYNKARQLESFTLKLLQVPLSIVTSMQKKYIDSSISSRYTI